jgi:hypothetical protein
VCTCTEQSLSAEDKRYPRPDIRLPNTFVATGFMEHGVGSAVVRVSAQHHMTVKFHRGCVHVVRMEAHCAGEAFLTRRFRASKRAM